MSPKQFMEIKEQLQQLKDRGLDVSGFQEKDFISMNYYKVVNGYKEGFIDKSSTSEKYLAGSTLLEVVDLYLFDMKLSSIFIKYLLEAERKIVSVFSYYFTKRFGNEAQISMMSYDARISTNDIKECVEGFKDFVQKSKEDNILHYIQNHNVVPFWVVAQHIDFGKLKTIYNLCDPLVKLDVASHFGQNVDDFNEYFHAVYIARNKAAHNNRFFNIVNYTRINSSGEMVRAIKIPITTHTNGARKDKVSAQIISGVSDVAAIIIALSKVLAKSTVNNLMVEIDNLLGNTKFSSIKLSKIKFEMGLPLNIFDIVK